MDCKNRSCLNCLYRVFDITTNEVYCGKNCFDLDCEFANFSLYALNCSQFKLSFFEVEENKIELVEEVPF